MRRRILTSGQKLKSKWGWAAFQEGLSDYCSFVKIQVPQPHFIPSKSEPLGEAQNSAL